MISLSEIGVFIFLKMKKYALAASSESSLFITNNQYFSQKEVKNAKIAKVYL